MTSRGKFWGGQAKFWGGSGLPWHPPSSAKGSQCFQKARVANFSSLSFYSCVTIGRESRVHSACRVLYCACFWSSDKTYTMLLPGICSRGMNEATALDNQGMQWAIQRVKLQKVHLSKSCN